MIYVLIILIIFFILLVIHSYLVIDISRYTIKDKRIDKNIKMLLLSDLHNRDIKDKLSKIINKEKPDLIILSGDMINEFVGDQENFIKLIPILEKYKTYYTFGNHEEACIKELKNDYMNRLSKTKLILLNDDSVSLSKNIKLYGLDVDISFFEGLRKKKLDNKYIESRLGKLDNKKYNIAIAHNPLMAYAYTKYGFDLVFSGHVHGGLVRLPFLGGFLSPEYKFFPKYYEGFYDVDGMKMIVSRGLGFCKRLPIRILNPGEVVVINICKD